MSGQAGFDGILTINDTEVGIVQDVNFNGDTDEIEDTARDAQGYKTFIPGLKNWTVTFNLRHETGNSMIALLRQAWLANTILEGIQFLDKNGEGFEGDVFVKSFAEAQPIQGLVTKAITLRGRSALTVVEAES